MLAATMQKPLPSRRFFSGLVLAVLLPGAGCTTRPVRPIPDPLPETLAWSEEGSRARSFLGLKTRENTGDSLEELSFEPGVYVRAVTENSPAEAAGFRVGDVVLALADHPIDDPETLMRRVEDAAPGDEVRIRVQRGDSVFEVPVVLGMRGGRASEPERLFRKDPARSLAGWKGGGGGVRLVSSDEEGPFPSAGVPVGSIVYTIDGREVLSARGLIRTLGSYEPGARVEVGFSGGVGERRSATVRLHAEERLVTDVSVPILGHFSRDLERDRVSFVLVDLWFLSLFRYERDGEEKRYRFLRFFRFSTGEGELSG